MEYCRSNGCRRALFIALNSHCKLVEHDIDNKVEEIIQYIQYNLNIDYGRIFKQVATIALLLNQDHPFGQYAMSFNHKFFKSLCNKNYSHIGLMCTSELNKLYPEIFLNSALSEESDMMASRVEYAIDLVCNAIYCDYEDPFQDISLPNVRLCKNTSSSTYDIKYDYHQGNIHYRIDDMSNHSISVREVAECIARCPDHPVNPLTGKTLTLDERKLICKKLYMEIACIQYFLTHVEYKECGYKVEK